MNKISRRVVAGAAAAAGLAVSTGIALTGDVVVLAGDVYRDCAGQHLDFDDAHGGVLAGDPVVVTVNGRRYL